MNKPLVIAGLTGSIGMGKSVATSMLRAMGVPVHCSDEAVHALLAPGGDAINAVAATFPGVLSKTGGIDRQALGALVFADDLKKKQLENILHPLVVASQSRFISEQIKHGQTLVVLDIPLLYETGAEARVDKVIVVSAPSFIQRTRVMKRPGMSREKFENILRSQMPDAEKRRRADYVVQTGIGMAYTRRALARIIQQLNAQ